MVQEKIASEAEKELSARLNVPVTVGKVDIEWLNRLVLGDVSIDDQNGQKLFEADHISAGFKIWPLLHGQWVFTTVRLFGFSLNIERETPDSPLNLQFVMDAFASKDTLSKTSIDLKINSIIIRRGRLRYDVLNVPFPDNRFSAGHIHLEDINGKIILPTLHAPTFSVEIHKLSMKERSGFRLNKLSAFVTGNQDSVTVRQLKILLPQTQLHIAGVSVRSSIDRLVKEQTEAPLAIQIAPSEISLSDLSAFVPAFQNASEPFQLSASASGTMDNLTVRDLTVRQGRTLSLKAQMNLKNIWHPEKSYLFGQISNLQLASESLERIIHNFQETPVSLPTPINRLGMIHFTGEISGFIDQLVAFGKLSSDIGSLEMDMLIGREKEHRFATYLKGKISSSELDIAPLFNENTPYGKVQFKAELDASKPANGAFSGTVQAKIDRFEYEKYTYENILLSGGFRPKEFNGTIRIDDPNGKLHAEGLFNNNGEQSEFNFSATLEHFRPDKLHLTEKYDSPELSFQVNSNITGNHIDNFQGQITIDNLSFLTRTDTFLLNTAHIQASGISSERKLTVYSDLLNGEVTGSCSFTHLLPSLVNLIRPYLPSLSTTFPPSTSIGIDSYSFTINIENTERLSKALKLPVALLAPSRIFGHYDNPNGRFHLNASLPRFEVSQSVFKDGSIVLNNPNGAMEAEIRATQLQQKGSQNQIHIKADAANDRLRTSFTLENNQKDGVKIALSSSTQFSITEEDGSKKLLSKISIEPNRIIVKDSTWNIQPASITIDKEKIFVDNIHLSKGDQYLRINGTISSFSPQETLTLDLNDIELSYIFDIVNIPALQFGGRATGTFRLNDLYGSRIINTNLEVQDFSFNRVVQGRLNLFSEWDNDQNGILLLGTIYKDRSTWTDVNGYIYPVGEKEGLSLYFDAKDLDIGLLRPYLSSFTQVFEGNCYGNLHLYGPFSDLSFEGKALIRNGRIGVDFLQTVYSFSDSVFMTPTTIEGRNIVIHDKHGNKGAVDFTVQHDHLRDFGFSADIKANNLLLYDASERINPNIYGVLYGTGNASLRGTERLIHINANMRSDRNTTVGFNFANGSSAEEYDFIRFKDNPTTKDSTLTRTIAQAANDDNEGTEIRINIVADVTPDAKLELILDPVSGDKIKGDGSGNLQIQYGTSSNLAMYGGYTIREGSYNFSLQQLIRKDFKIREGSRIDFRGDPLSALLSLDASYHLKANIQDLDERLAVESGIQRNIPVNCLLKLNGRLQNPTISFDMEFPNSTHELARQVRSFIGTEDMMTRQIVYLLVLNKFYTPDYSKNAYRSNEFSAMASSALSSQLSGILNSLTDKVQIGTNIRSRQDGVTDTEVEMLLSSQLLNNRLLFNGNFGYRDNYIQNNAFVGEFDLEYKLTPSGEIRLKAYNHANDMYYRYNMKSPTRQGVGLMFHKDFSTLSEIFRRRKKRTANLF
ncbi:translocation/assembly module TamB domain-containing protein [Tannerella sp.]|uniref:translocation/assembly module TamB domain-containing protein n=1 Tax=Tannerella sp. TaxID=2382127 RepID=UPI003FA1ABA6